jgi:hypothetical protein
MIKGGRSIASALDNTPQYFRQKCKSSRHVQQGLWIGVIKIEISISYQTPND